MVLKNISLEKAGKRKPFFCITSILNIFAGSPAGYRKPAICIDRFLLQSFVKGQVYEKGLEFFKLPFSWAFDNKVLEILELDTEVGAFYRISDLQCPFFNTEEFNNIGYDTIAYIISGSIPNPTIVYYRHDTKKWYHSGKVLETKVINVSHSYVFLLKRKDIPTHNLYQRKNNVGFIARISNDNIFYGLSREEFIYLPNDLEKERDIVLYKDTIQFDCAPVNYENSFVKKEISDYPRTLKIERPYTKVLTNKGLINKSCADFIKDENLLNFTYYYSLENTYANGFTIKDINDWVNFIKPFIECDVEIKEPVPNPDNANSFIKSMHLPLEIKNCKNHCNYSNYLRIILLRYILSANNGSIVKLSMDIYESLRDEFNITQWTALLIAHYYTRDSIEDSLGNNPKMNSNFKDLAMYGQKIGVNDVFKNTEGVEIPTKLFIDKDYKSIYLTLKQKYDTL